MRREMGIFTTAHEKWWSMEDDSDLRKNHLTLQEYHAMASIFKTMGDLKTPGYTFQKGVADWFKRNGFTVIEEGINYRITLKEGK